MSGEESGARRSPFVGLQPFEPEDAAFFFGRAQESASLAGALLGNALTVLFGPPGAGKTSLIRVRVAAQLAAATDNEARIIHWNRWQPGFLEELNAEVGQKLGRSGTLHAMVAGHVESGDAPVFLLFDQFEEYFRYVEDPVRTPFAKSLALIANDRTLDAHILLALREDSLSLLDRLRVRLPNILGNTLELRPLDRAAAREAILSPLELWRKRGLPGPAAEPAEELVTALLDQTDQAALRAGNIGAAAAEATTRGRVETAFLQLALQRLWDVELAAKSPAMRVETLNGKSLDGVRGIVKAHLHEALGHFTNDQRHCLALMFRYLVTPSGGKQANSAVDLFVSLNDGGDKALSAQALRGILEQLAAADRRILRTQPNVSAPDDGPLFELFHDALAQPVLEWTQGERAAELRRQRDKARRQVRLAGAGIGVLVVLLVIAVIAGLLARGAIKEAATQNRDLMLSQSRFIARVGQENFDKGFAEQSYLIESQAFDRLKHVDSSDAAKEKKVVEEKLNKSAAAAVAPALEELAELEDPTAAALEDQHPPAAPNHPGSLAASKGQKKKEIVNWAMTSDGKRVIIAYDTDATAVLWDLTKAPPVATKLKGDNKTAVQLVAISPDGTHAITASADSTWGWDLAGPLPAWAADPIKPLLKLEGKADLAQHVTFSPAQGVTFSDDGNRAIISQSNNTALVWDLSARPPVSLDFKDHNKITSASFLPDGKHAITTFLESGKLELWFWDLTGDSSKTKVFDESVEGFKHLDVSPDWKRLLISTADTTKVWDLSGSKPVETVLKDEKEPVNASAFNHDGTRVIITSAHDTTARVWDLSKSGSVKKAKLDGHDINIGHVWLSEDGKSAITLSSEQPSDRSSDSMLFWNLTGPNPVETKGELFDYNASLIKPSSDLTHILTLRGNIVRSWDIATLSDHDPAGIRKLADAQLRRRWDDRQQIASKADDPDRPGCLSEVERVELTLTPPPPYHPASSERVQPEKDQKKDACPEVGSASIEAGIWGEFRHMLHLLALGIEWRSAADGAPLPDGAPPDASVTPTAKGH